MIYIWITMRCYFAFLSIDTFVLFTRYSLRYWSLKLDISSIQSLLFYKVYDIRFRSEISARLSKADKGHRSLSEAI